MTLDISDFDINDKPHYNPAYPFNFLSKAEFFADQIENALIKPYGITELVIENTQLGHNRHAQRMLEFLHFAVLKKVQGKMPVHYYDPTRWRSILQIKMTKEQRAHNKDVKAKKAKGKITFKHLSVEWANKNYGLQFLIKDNDQADAVCMGTAHLVRRKQK